jgi:ABC-2 type transport system ATP-binding protein
MDLSFGFAAAAMAGTAVFCGSTGRFGGSTLSNSLVVNGVSQEFSMHREQSFKEWFAAGLRNRSEKFWALKDVSFEVPTGVTVGLIGRNGSGKSTLLKVIGGILQPTTGHVEVSGHLAALLELGAGFNPDMTGRENVYLNSAIMGIPKQKTKELFENIVDFSGIRDFIDTPVKFYSSGMYMRLGFSIAIHTDPDVLLIDEVLAVGDQEFAAKCLRKIRQFQSEGRSIILVTHDMDTVLEFCQQAVLLRHGELIASGDPRQVITTYRSLVEERETYLRGPSTGPACISSVTWTSGHESNWVNALDPVSIEIALDGNSVAEGAVVRLQVWSDDGLLLFETDSHMHGLKLPAFDGTLTTRFDLAALHLGAGSYHLSVEVAADPDAIAWDRIENAYTFIMTGTDKGRGKVGIRVNASIS